MTELRCLTIRQPWASLLVDPTLPKWIETRSRRTNIRGTIGIIAGKWAPSDCTFDVGDYEMAIAFSSTTEATFPLRLGWVLNGGSAEVCDLPLGALIGTVDLYDCVPMVEWRDAGNIVGREVNFDGAWHHPARDESADWFRANPARLKIDRTGSDWLLTMQSPEPGAVVANLNRDVSDQLPYGEFAPGRWAWLTRNPVLFDEPVPMPGSQGWKTIQR